MKFGRNFKTSFWRVNQVLVCSCFSSGNPITVATGKGSVFGWELNLRSCGKQLVLESRLRDILIEWRSTD